MKPPKITKRQTEDRSAPSEYEQLVLDLISYLMNNEGLSKEKAMHEIESLRSTVRITGVYKDGKIIMDADALFEALKWRKLPINRRKYQMLIKDTMIDASFVPWIES